MDKIQNNKKPVEKKKRLTKKQRFWRIFGAYLAVMVLASLVGLRFFYDYTSEYEKTRPDSAAREVCNNFGDGILKELLSSKFADKVSEYESLDRAIQKVLIPAIGSEYSFRKLATEYTSERPVYTILSNGRELANIAFVPSENTSKFGLREWVVESSELLVDLSSVHTFQFSLKVPHGVSVYVNGIKLDPSLVVITEVSDTAKFESDPSVVPEVDVYKLDGFLAVPYVRALDENGVEYVSSYTETGCKVECPDGLAHTLRITAPSDATVTVGKSKVGEEQISNYDVPYKNAEGFNAAFKMTEYTIRGLKSEPTFSVKSPTGDELEMTVLGDDTYLFTLPQDKLHRVTIQVPSEIETEIKVNGIVLTDAQLSVSDTLPVYPELSEISQFIKGDAHPVEYVIEGLYETPVVEVSAKDGSQLVPSKTDDPDMFVFTPPYDDSLIDANEAVVMKFVSAYINYTANGGTDTMTHFAKVDACLLPKSQAYTEMHNTVYSFSQNFQFKVVSQKITTSDYQSWGEDCFSCTAHYDVTLSRWKTVEDSGTMKLFFVRSGGVWLLAKINI